MTKTTCNLQETDTSGILLFFCLLYFFFFSGNTYSSNRDYSESVALISLRMQAKQGFQDNILSTMKQCNTVRQACGCMTQKHLTCTKQGCRSKQNLFFHWPTYGKQLFWSEKQPEPASHRGQLQGKQLQLGKALHTTGKGAQSRSLRKRWQQATIPVLSVLNTHTHCETFPPLLHICTQMKEILRLNV